MDDAAICEESKSNLKTFFNTMLENSVSYLITDEQKKIFLEHCSEGVCASIDGISDATTKIKDELSVRYSLVGQVIMMEALALHIERQVAVIEDMAMT